MVTSQEFRARALKLADEAAGDPRTLGTNKALAAIAYALLHWAAKGRY